MFVHYQRFWYLPNLNLPVILNHLTTVLLLGGRGQYLEHTLTRLINRNDGLVHTENAGGGVADLRLGETGVEDETVQPGVFGVDADSVPVHDGF